MLADLQDEINLARTQLENLDPDEDEYHVKKMVLEHGLASLEDRYENEAPADYVQPYGEEELSFEEDNRTSLPIVGEQRPHTSDASTNKASIGGFPSYNRTFPNGYGGHFASDPVLSAQDSTVMLPSGGFDTLDDTMTTPDESYFPSNGRFSTGSADSLESGFLRPPKRQRESLDASNNAAAHPSKSMRTTPSPAITGSTTPTSFSSFEIPDDPDILALLGGNVEQDLRDYREEEEAFRAKKEQERADAEFARQLQEQENRPTAFGDYSGSASSGFGSSRPNSSMAPKPAAQTTLDSNGRYRRPDPYTFSSSPATVKSEDPYATSLPVKQENSYESTHKPIKYEGSFMQQPVRSRSPDFIDLENDDLFYQYLEPATNDPSSDLVEIDASAFGNTARQDHPESSAAAAAIHPYGSSRNPSSSNWSYSAGELGKSLASTANNLYNGAYNMLGQQLSGYGNMATGYGGTSVYGQDILGSADVIDLETYDPSPEYLAQDIFNRHGINAEDPANQALVASYMNRVDYVANDPTRTAAEIKSLLENIRPDEELPPENREGTPEAMTYALMEHQKLGLTWMKSMEEGSNKGGILADAMGLGKTIQALALIVSRQSPDRLCKTTLIVCPVALLRQWHGEIRTKLKADHQLKVYTLHNEKRYIKWESLKTYDVVLTTFGTLGTEVKRREGIEMNKRMNPSWQPSGKSDYLPLLGDECKWYRVIIDEAQCIKNKNTKAAVGAALLQAQTRFCMSGTPMMNRVDELFSLIHFLRIKPYCVADKFGKDFTRPLKGHSEVAKSKAMRQLQALLKAILLRRTKQSQIDGKPILNLPERTTNCDHATFTDDETAFYRALESRTQLQFNKYLKAGTVGRNYSNILVLLLRLRQACCHPHLIKDFGQTSGASEVSSEDMQNLAKELAPDVVTRIKEQCGLTEDGALECPVCMDMADNATIFIPCGHNTCSECFARISDPSQAIADGSAAEGRNLEVKCPNCRGRVIPTKVIDHNAFKHVFMPELVTNGDLIDDPEDDAESSEDSDTDEDDGDTDDEDEDVDSKGNIKGFIVDDDDVDDESESADEGDDSYRASKTPFEKSTKKKSKKVNKGKGKAQEVKGPKKTLAELKKEGMRNLKARKKYLKRLQKDWVPSAKTERTIELLREIRERKDPETKQCEKTIIFSQFTSLLDLLEVPIAREGWDYRRYDGSMSANARNEAVVDFTEKKGCKIMLVSLKAGNAGLNLVAASQVIILDPFWNPYIEEQAIDRAHRIGQQKPVQVHRILIPNTVEDRILALQEKKRELIEGALDEKASQSIGRLGERELGFLFDVPT